MSNESARPFDAPSHVRWGVMLSLALAFVGVAAAVGRLINSLGLAAQRPEFTLTYTGGVIAWLAKHPENWYQSLGAAPHFPTIYTPGYFAVVNTIHAATGLPVPILQRGLGLISILAASALLYAVVQKTTGHRVAGVVAGSLYVLSPAVARSTTLARVDHLGIAFGLAAVYIVATRDTSEWTTPVAAALACVDALAIKQSLVAFPVAVFLALVLADDFTAVRRYITAGLGFGGVFALAVTAVYGGQFWIHTLALNAENPLVLGRLVGQAGWATYVHLPVAAVALWTLYHYGSEESHIPAVVPTLVVVGAGVAMLTLGKQGSWIGYAYPFVAGAALCVGYLVAEYVPAPGVDWQWQTTTATAVVLLLVAAQLGIYASWQAGTVTEPEHQAEVADLVAAADGPVLSEDAGLLVATGSAEAYEPLAMKYATGRLWDQTELTDRIRDHEFEYIITLETLETSGNGAGRWTERQKGVITAEYELERRVGQYRIYVPAEVNP